jgi:hypothetical protein
MRVNLRGADIPVAEEFLNRTDFIPVFKVDGLQKNAKTCGGLPLKLGRLQCDGCFDVVRT